MKIIETTEDIYCPYCNKPLDALYKKFIKINMFGKKPLYACSNCRKVLPGLSY